MTAPAEPPKKPEQPKGGPSGSGGTQGSGNPLALVGSGLEIAGAVGILALLGWWLDGYFGTEPWLLVAGAMFGLVGGLYNLWKSSQKYL